MANRLVTQPNHGKHIRATNDMKMHRSLAHLQFPLAVTSIATLALAGELHAGSGNAMVRGITGQALVSKGDAPAQPLVLGSLVQAGSVIKTGVRSAVDLYLGDNVGILRLTQGTVLRLDKLDVSETNRTHATEIQLHLEAGTILGDGARSGFSVTNQVKVSNGVGAIGTGLYRINSDGYVVLLDGSFIFVHVPTGSDLKAHDLKAPPPVYFSPVEGVRPAPASLINEIQNQWKARLRSEIKMKKREPEARPAAPPPRQSTPSYPPPPTENRPPRRI
jgi:hypothetical protein